MQTLARTAIKHRWWVVGGWLLAIVAIQLLASASGGAAYKDDFKLPGTEAQTVADLLRSSGLDQQNNPVGTMVLHPRSGTLDGNPPAVMAAARALCADPTAPVAGITTAWSTLTCADRSAGSAGVTREQVAPRPDLLNPDRTVSLVQIGFSVPVASVDDTKLVYEQMKKAGSPDLQVEFTGDVFTDVDATSGGVSPQILGFAAAFVILILVFRTLGATVLPLVSAAAALGSGLGVLALLTHVMSVAAWAPQLADLMVIGVGIDYALFIVTRHRRNLLGGMSVADSITNAVNTSGRAVLLAGMTVCIALLGLCALGVSFLYGVAVGTSLGVALTMVASLTLLPALLSFLGLKVLPRRQRKAVRAGHFTPLGATHGRWYSWGRLVERRATLFALGSGAVIVALAIPFFSLHLGHADQSNDAAGTTTRRGYDLIQTGFGRGFNSGLELVVSGPDAADKAYLAKVAGAVSALDNVDPDTVTVIPAGRSIAFISFKSVSGPQDVATDNLVRTLRSDVLPPLYRSSADSIYVYGVTAVFVDFSKVLSAKMLFFILAVVGLSFLLLVVAFRSIVIPATAAAMNLLAAGASFGVVVAIFQWGWFGDAIGVGGGGPIEAFVPVIFFAVLFGLSMDYQVFLVSRMHEEWIHTGDNRRAVTVGQSETGGIITAAGLIMIAVFGGFILGDGRVIKLFGIGLASAIFIDAFIVRTMLVPALMHKLGRWNWRYPWVLERITPRVSLEAPAATRESADDDLPELARV